MIILNIKGMPIMIFFLRLSSFVGSGQLSTPRFAISNWIVHNSQWLPWYQQTAVFYRSSKEREKQSHHCKLFYLRVDVLFMLQVRRTHNWSNKKLICKSIQQQRRQASSITECPPFPAHTHSTSSCLLITALPHSAAITAAMMIATISTITMTVTAIRR